MTLIPHLTFSLLPVFHGAFVTGVACQQGKLTFHIHSNAMILLSEQNSPVWF